jgi:hypothetical protein
MEDERGCVEMNISDISINNDRQREEERKKKECAPYEEIIRKLIKQNRERAKLEQSPTNRRS